jgi:LacI family transcriptional regulator
MKVTILDVARRAGVSTATVSNVVNSTGRFSPKTRRCVLNAINDLKYYPNAHARNLASHRSRILGIIVSDISNPFFPTLIKSFEERARQHGYEAIVSDTGFNLKQMMRALERMLEQKVRGVAIMTSEMSPASIKTFLAQDIAVTFLDVGLVGRNTSNISLDYFSGVNQVVEHLYQLGHRLIAFVAGPSRLKNVLARQRAYVHSMTSLGLEPSPIVRQNMTYKGGYKAGLRIARMSPRPTAVITVNDFIATGVVKGLYSCDLRVPKDVSVVGFDNTWLAQTFIPALTSVDVHADLIGRTAADSLLRVSSPSEPMAKEYPISLHLVVRESTGTVSQNGVVRSRYAHASPPDPEGIVLTF